jgi:hypothetical protein
MGSIAPVYRPRDAEHTVLHQVVAEHLEAFLGAMAEAGAGTGLPEFVEREFREFLLCGVYEAGVARFQCEGCARKQRLGLLRRGREELRRAALRLPAAGQSDPTSVAAEPGRRRSRRYPPRPLR